MGSFPCIVLDGGKLGMRTVVRGRGLSSNLPGNQEEKGRRASYVSCLGEVHCVQLLRPGLRSGSQEA